MKFKWIVFFLHCLPSKHWLKLLQPSSFLWACFNACIPCVCPSRLELMPWILCPWSSLAMNYLEKVAGSYILSLAAKDSSAKNDRRRATDEEQLLDYLFANYKTEARPVLDSKDTVDVTIQFSLMHIKELVSLTMSFAYANDLDFLASFLLAANSSLKAPSRKQLFVTQNEQQIWPKIPVICHGLLFHTQCALNAVIGI